MMTSENSMGKIEAFKIELFKNLTIQDALVAIPVFTTEINRKNLKHIVYLAHAHPLFHEDVGVTEKRVNKFANLNIGTEWEKAIKLAARS